MIKTLIARKCSHLKKFRRELMNGKLKNVYDGSSGLNFGVCSVDGKKMDVLIVK